MENQKCSKAEVIVESNIPKNRQEILKWNGWGYKDSKFIAENEDLYFTGDRYPLANGLKLPFLYELCKIELGVNFQQKSNPKTTADEYPSPFLNSDFLNALDEKPIQYSTSNEDRLFRAHGHTLKEIYILRYEKFSRIPDAVVWPDCHKDVEFIMRLANELNVVIIPFGGGTSVTEALECPVDETRMIVSLDMSQMNKILWVDEENMTMCVEAGIIGQDLERELHKKGLTMGHEPDSLEFSSLGGWVATRASGMKKSKYGNIEDLVVHIKCVTPQGTIQKGCQVPRMSSGPDFHHLILGSEGTLGVVTEVICKVKTIPECCKYGSLVFPDFESGFLCLRDLARQQCYPTSIRLMDNEQFRLGRALKSAPSTFEFVVESIKKVYLTKLRGFKLDEMCVATLLFEGDEMTVKKMEATVYKTAAKYGGIPGGEENGKRGYMMTYVIAYIRDLGLDYYVLAESFETSAPWDRVIYVCSNVKHRISMECQARGIKYFLISCRITQSYDAGACIYFYFAFNYYGIQGNALQAYEEIEHAARDEIVLTGGSISHHHGVGKSKRKWYPQTVSQVGVGMYHVVKKHLDPNNILANGNLIPSKL